MLLPYSVESGTCCHGNSVSSAERMPFALLRVPEVGFCETGLRSEFA